MAFSIVEESLNRTTGNSSMENKAIFDELEQMMQKNPEKVKAWFAMASTVRNMSDSLFNYAQQLKDRHCKRSRWRRWRPIKH